MRVGILSRVASVRLRAFTLVEVVCAMAFVALLYSGIITAYIMSDRRAEWSGYSLAAQALAMRQLEQARAAKWDTSLGVQVDQILSGGPGFPTVTNTILDLPVSGTNVVWATSYLDIKNVTVTTAYTKVYSTGITNPFVKMMTVNTVWMFKGKLFTNSVSTYLAPDQ